MEQDKYWVLTTVSSVLLTQQHSSHDADDDKAWYNNSGVSSKKEAANFLVGRVGDPHMKNYVNHVTSHPSVPNMPHAIMPDIMAHN